MSLAQVQTSQSGQQIRAFFSLSASLAANSIVTGNLSLSQTDNTGTSPITVPPNEIWHFVDAYVSAALSVNILLDVKVGNTPQNLNFDTATMVASGGNTSRVNPFQAMQGLTIPGNNTITITGQTDAANGTTAATETVYFTVVRQPISNAGTPVLKNVQ